VHDKERRQHPPGWRGYAHTPIRAHSSGATYIAPHHCSENVSHCSASTSSGTFFAFLHVCLLISGISSLPPILCITKTPLLPLSQEGHHCRSSFLLCMISNNDVFCRLQLFFASRQIILRSSPAEISSNFAQRVRLEGPTKPSSFQPSATKLALGVSCLSHSPWKLGCCQKGLSQPTQLPHAHVQYQIGSPS